LLYGVLGIDLSDNVELIVKEAREKYWELRELLRRKRPELLPLYEARFEYLSENYSREMRLYNAYQILRAWRQPIP
jgi:hypothetical protein